MRRSIAIGVSVAMLAAAGTAAQARGRGHGMGGRVAADPSAVVAAEVALNQLALSKGQWAAMRDMAAPGAQLFTPVPVGADAFLKGRAEPAAPMDREAQEVWMSCDGRYALASGSSVQAGAPGRFFTIWQLQEKGGWKWLLDRAEPAGKPADDMDMIRAHVADCPAGRGSPPPMKPGKDAPAPAPVDPLNGTSGDGTLSWSTSIAPDGTRHVAVSFLGDGARRDVLTDTIPAR